MPPKYSPERLTNGSFFVKRKSPDVPSVKRTHLSASLARLWAGAAPPEVRVACFGAMVRTEVDEGVKPPRDAPQRSEQTHKQGAAKNATPCAAARSFCLGFFRFFSLFSRKFCVGKLHNLCFHQGRSPGASGGPHVRAHFGPRHYAKTVQSDLGRGARRSMLRPKGRQMGFS